MSTPESSLGARLNDVERKQAVHEAVCEERYKAINEGISQIRIDLAARGQKMESLVRAWAIVIAAAVAGFEFYRRAGGSISFPG
jgi:hypothetical protein